MVVLVGHQLSEKDHVDVILDGLLLEYNTFILSVDTRIEPYNIADIEAFS